MFDIIGDLHGCAGDLTRLLRDKLGYEACEGSFRHSERKVIFLGDYIDRGDEIVECLRIVRNMVEKGQALALMGNHEYNFICYHTEKDGVPLRIHSRENSLQLKKTIDQLQQADQKTEDWVNWFMTLPLIIEFSGIRAVHACWDDRQIAFLKHQLGPEYRLTPEFLRQSAQKGSAEYRMIGVLLKGLEVPLPPGCSYFDREGGERFDTRIKWWAKCEPGICYEQAAEKPVGKDGELKWLNIKDQPFPVEYLPAGYPLTAPPVFFGHYWHRGQPKPLTPVCACVDYSAADGGSLVAYRFDGERRLERSHFVSS